LTNHSYPHVGIGNQFGKRLGLCTLNGLNEYKRNANSKFITACERNFSLSTVLFYCFFVSLKSLSRKTLLELKFTITPQPLYSWLYRLCLNDFIRFTLLTLIDLREKTKVLHTAFKLFNSLTAFMQGTMIDIFYLTCVLSELVIIVTLMTTVPVV